ncbi:MAG: arsenate reductase (glutaredoxin) [Hydrogenophaga sp.]|nr:arsenate reductase (glutaredoxin) [Hydrogenophaga sp.]
MNAPQSTSPADVTIFHNPACGTSRQVLATIREAGMEPMVVEYLKTPYTRSQLVALMTAAGLGARELLRSKGPLYEELGLAAGHWTEEQLIDQMVAHPGLVNRPIVVTPKGTRLCRPADVVREIL